jgi:hypothetical protein
MASARDAIADGAAAWQHPRERERATWSLWLTLGRALIIGRTEALKIAKTNCAVGSGYNAAMGQWLRNNGLDGITPQERYRVILCIENLTMVEQWRAGLEEAQRRRLNHPGAILTHWRRSIKAESAAPTRQCVRGAKPHRSGMPIFWPQETRCGEPLKRFATADQTTSSR